MWGAILRFFGRAFGHVGSLWTWFGHGGLLTAMFTLLASYIEPIAELGWPAVILTAVVVASLFMIGASLAAMAWAAFRRPQLAITPTDDAAASSPAAPHDNADGDDDAYSNDPEAEAIDKVAYNDLLAFSIDKVLPACEALDSIDSAVISAQCPNETIRTLALVGAHNSDKENYKTRDYFTYYQRLSSGLIESPGPIIKFDAMVDCIYALEKGAYAQYHRRVCERTHDASIAPSDREQIQDAWEDWRKYHNELIRSYEAVKRDSRFGKLLRPARPSRWGTIVDPAPEGESLASLVQRGIVKETQQ